MRTARILAVSILAMICAVSLSAQTLSSRQDRKAKLERDIKMLEKQLDAATSKRDNAASRLNILKAQTDARRELLKESEAELKAVEDSVRLCRRRIESATARLDTMTRYYTHLVGKAYRNRDSRLWYMYILASDNVGQGLRRYSYLRRLSARMNEQGREIISERERLESEKQRFDSLRVLAGRLRDERAAEVGKLRKEEDKSRELVKRLQQDRSRYISQLTSKRKEVEALNREIARLISQEIDGAGKGGTQPGVAGGRKTDTRIDTKLSNQFSANKGKLPWPADGRVVSHFGRNPHPVYSKLEMPFNNGVGIAVPTAAPAKAVFNGVVKQIVLIPGYNQCILVQHGEYFTFYCKLGSVAVKSGDKVKTGQVLGYVADGTDDTQLHFQLWKGKTPQNPENWLR